MLEKMFAGDPDDFSALCEALTFSLTKFHGLGPGPWIVTRKPSPAVEGIRIASPEDVETLGDELRHWLDAHRVEAALIRPDLYVFGSGVPQDLADRYAVELSGG
jgi:hypothetical protein